MHFAPSLGIALTCSPTLLTATGPELFMEYFGVGIITILVTLFTALVLWGVVILGIEIGEEL